MTHSVATDLQRYLQQARDTLVGALAGLSEYDVRRPLTPTGTNLLGLVKHLAGIEFGYLGDCVGRPPPVTLPWNEDGSVWDGADMWAAADQSGLPARPLPDGLAALRRVRRGVATDRSGRGRVVAG